MRVHTRSICERRLERVAPERDQIDVFDRQRNERESVRARSRFDDAADTGVAIRARDIASGER